ncbi:MAG TPA: tRNA (guanosine(37)-N1)-methyltransferase TrmD [Clostridiales bacterium]|jgi:tRNA (guanine37-N1)-methyltransferase|nr:tRNA (guanosine(37)-N1)-methyltransferase TrmD [Clostridiales bacterium]
MKISVLTLFPEMFDSLKHSILKRAIENKALQIEFYNIRDYSKDPHKKCDDYSFGGGEGMVMMPQPVYDALEAADPGHKARRVYLSPKGHRLNQSLAKDLSRLSHLVLLCGHYEGLDQRIIDHYIDQEISIGDYVLTGGELAAQVVIDCIARLLPGVLGNEESAMFESFENNMLEYPHYTRPREFMGHSVPEVLLSGNHQKIKKWREAQSRLLTKKLRPDLLKE